GDAGLACRTAAERAAFLQQAAACRAMDGAIDAASAQQAFICGIDDDVDFRTRDVALFCADDAHLRPQNRMNQAKPSTTSAVIARPRVSVRVSFTLPSTGPAFANRISRAIMNSGKVKLMAMMKPKIT